MISICIFVSTMTTLSRLILYYGIATIQIITVVNSEKAKLPTLPSMVPTKPEKLSYHSSDGITGVSSVAQVTSKDGKVSSTAGVKFYSPGGTKLTKKSDIMQPWTFSKRTKDGFAMGAVQVYPGSVMASASSYQNPKTGAVQIYPSSVMAAASSYEHPKGDFGQMNRVTNWPMPYSFFPHTFTPIMSNTYSPVTHRNSYSSNYMFREFDPFIPDIRNTWYRPYDPFNDFWN